MTKTTWKYTHNRLVKDLAQDEVWLGMIDRAQAMILPPVQMEREKGWHIPCLLPDVINHHADGAPIAIYASRNEARIARWDFFSKVVAHGYLLDRGYISPTAPWPRRLEYIHTDCPTYLALAIKTAKTLMAERAKAILRTDAMLDGLSAEDLREWLWRRHAENHGSVFRGLKAREGDYFTGWRYDAKQEAIDAREAERLGLEG